MVLHPPSVTVSVRRWLAASICVLALVGGASLAWADPCITLFQQKKYEQASDCFVKKAQKMGPSNKLSNNAKIEKGRWLLNASVSLQRAAKQSGASQAAGLRSKAMMLLKRILNEKLADGSDVRASLAKRITKLRGQIGFATVVVITNHPQAKACLQGKGAKKCKRGMLWKSKVLPQSYTISVTYPLQPPVTKSKIYNALPRTEKTLVFTPPVKKEALLSIATGDPKATMSVQNLKTKKSLAHQGAFWSKTLSPGRYALKIVYPGQSPLTRTIVMREGKPEVLVFRKPGPPVLIIDTVPINAQVFVDGKYRGNTGIKLKLKPGKRVIELKRGCYVIHKVSQVFKLNQERTLSIQLKRDPAYVSWKSSKKGSNGGTIAGWSVFALGIAAAGVGGAMQGLASGKHGEAGDLRAFDFANFQRLADEGNTFRSVGYASLAVGVVGIGAGITTLLLSRPKSKFNVPCAVPIKDED